MAPVPVVVTRQTKPSMFDRTLIESEKNIYNFDWDFGGKTITFLHPNYYVKEHIPIFLEEEKGKFIAISEDLQVWGSGDTEEKAINDLREAIIELYETLKENSKNLGPLPRKIWLHLKNIVKEI